MHPDDALQLLEPPTRTRRDTPTSSPAPAPAPAASARAMRPSLSVVLPCHNEAANLDLLVPQLLLKLPQLADRWEVLLVDDGSTDDTMQAMRKWCSRPQVRAVRLSRNFGKEAALTAGLEHARGDVVVTMDADMQHPPALLAQMLAHWQAGADVVYAVRAHRRDETGLKRAGTRLFYSLLNGFERYTVPPGAGDFRLMDRAVVQALLALPERTRFMKGLYAWVGFDAVPLPYEPPPRAHGRSRFNLRSLVSLSLTGLTAFTTWPLRLATVAGLAVALGSLGYGLWLVASYLAFGHPVSGWTTIVVGVAFLAGVQMVLLGIVGEYVGRIFEEVKRRPLYLVKESLGRGLDEAAR